MYKDIPGIYSILCIPNNKQLIGETQNVKKRLSQHKNRLINNTHENPYFQKAFNKYGLKNFEFKLLEYCQLEDCKIREHYYCNLYNTHNSKKGYNIRPTGLDLKGKMLKETIEKIKNSLKNSEKFKNRDSGKGMRGKSHTEETKLKMSNSAKGKILSQETKNKLSISLKNRVIKEETLKKIVITRKANNTIWHSEATKEKMSKSSKGKPKSKLHCENIKLSLYKSVLQYDLEGNFIKELLGASQIRDVLGYNQSNITSVCNGLRKTHKGYIWKYKEKEN
jgi:group I intron endonuclease